MLNRIAGIVGWIGTGLVAGAVAIRLFKPEFASYGYWLAWAGLACVVFYMLGQWRDVAKAMGRKQTRLSTIALAGVLIVLGLLIAGIALNTRRDA